VNNLIFWIIVCSWLIPLGIRMYNRSRARRIQDENFRGPGYPQQNLPGPGYPPQNYPDKTTRRRATGGRHPGQVTPARTTLRRVTRSSTPHSRTTLRRATRATRPSRPSSALWMTHRSRAAVEPFIPQPGPLGWRFGAAGLPGTQAGRAGRQVQQRRDRHGGLHEAARRDHERLSCLLSDLPCRRSRISSPCLGEKRFSELC
jgi:hypothetical protein